MTRGKYIDPVRLAQNKIKAEIKAKRLGGRHSKQFNDEECHMWNIISDWNLYEFYRDDLEEAVRTGDLGDFPRGVLRKFRVSGVFRTVHRGPREPLRYELHPPLEPKLTYRTSLK